MILQQKLTDEQITDLGLEINEILEKADGYYYPSLKQYAQWMFDPEYTQNLQELWHSFCWTFDRQYEKFALTSVYLLEADTIE